LSGRRGTALLLGYFPNTVVFRFGKDSLLKVSGLEENIIRHDEGCKVVRATYHLLFASCLAFTMPFSEEYIIDRKAQDTGTDKGSHAESEDLYDKFVIVGKRCCPSAIVVGGHSV